MTATTTAITPTARQRVSAWRGWLVIAVIVLLGVAALFVLRGGQAGAGTPLAADNAAPAGSRALVEVLRGQGVSVAVADTLGEARRQSTENATVLLYDPNGYLDAEQLRVVGDLGERTVVVEPGFEALRALSPGVLAAGSSHGDESVRARCALPAAERAGAISTPLRGYRVQHASADRCFALGGGAYGVVRVDRSGHQTTVVGSTGVFDNEHIIVAGNAALALGLLGESDSVVWYLPSPADIAHPGPPTAAQLTPGWVTPVVVLLMVVFVAAAVWRGRRFGPLVVENLPVVVPARETMEGRARLYQRSSARLRALDALRAGTIVRVARLLGLPSSASLQAVVTATAAATGRAPAEVAGILVDERPETDAALMTLSDRLAGLERAVRAATTPLDAAPGADRPAPRDDEPHQRGTP